MTLYYIKQDDSYAGCSEPGCCGESYEATVESFVNCECEQVFPDEKIDWAEHLWSCNGGGPVLEWRKAKKKEILAYEGGKTDGYSEGWEAGAEWQKKQGENE